MNQIRKTEIIALFSMMRHFYGAKWESVNGPAIDEGGKLSTSAKLWLEGLAEYSSEQLAAGIHRLKQRKPEWPPGLFDLQNLMENHPTVEQILDRSNNYGDVCFEIRSRIDWFNVDGMSSDNARKAVAAKRQQVIESMRASGEMLAISRDEAIALAGPSKRPESAT